MNPADCLAFRCRVLDAPSFDRARLDEDGALVVYRGRIIARGSFDSVSRDPRFRQVQWSHLPHVLLVPGLIDVHTHLPQYPAVARSGPELLPWLREQIFPLERQFSGPSTRAAADAFFADLAANGTTSASIFCAVFEDSATHAFESAVAAGLRITMGKVMMDVASYGNLQPRKIVAISLAETARLIERWHGGGDGRLRYAVSPRFAVCCSERLMRDAAALAEKHGTFIQTHLAENIEEIQKVRSLFTTSRDYTDVYDQCRMLGPRTILGHCLHLSAREIDVIAARQCAVAHCPTSNLFLRSGLIPLDRLRAAGITIGLGSDVAAGPELDMWRVMRSAVEIQAVRAMHDQSIPILSPTGAFFLATVGGASVLRQAETLGVLESGFAADFVALDLREIVPSGFMHGALDRLAGRSAADLVSLCVYRAGPHAVLGTFVDGQPVFQRSTTRLLPTS